MTPLFSYLLQGSLVTAIFLLFYKLLLRQETFFYWSRWYFLSALVASFLLPLVDLSALLQQQEEQPLYISYVPDLSFSAAPPAQDLLWPFLSRLLLAGMLVMLLRLLLQMSALIRLRQNKRILHQEQFRIVELKEQVNPFSFFHEIYVNPSLHSEQELQEIIQHEQFHIRQKHTLDILLSELLTIVFWFNPFAWYLKNALKQNLEFLTDRLVLKTGVDSKHYQYNLLKVSTLQTNISTANHFYFLKLKNRILMMNKQESPSYRLVKYLLLIPVVAVLLMAFSERKQLKEAMQRVVLTDTIPVQTEVVKDVRVTLAGTDTSGIATIKIEKKNDTEMVTIVLKNGKQEVYNLRNEQQKKEFERKYGKLAKTETITITVPPPPAVIPPENPAIPPAPPAEPVLNSKGYLLSVADDEGECVVIVRDKSRSILKAVPFTEWDANKEQFEKKYGPVPPAKKTTVFITTDASKDGPANPYQSGAGTMLLKPGILIIVDEKEMPAGFDVNSIKPEQIATINVLKNESAVVRFGEKGKNGVIEIRMKEPSSVKTTLKTTTNTSTPLTVVNGKILSNEEIKNINPQHILKVEVLKGEAAIKLYGEAGRDGVVIITTKE